MEQLSIWDIENAGIITHENTGHIIGIGEEITLIKFKPGDYLKDSLVLDKLSGKLYLKQESRRKEPFTFIDWPMVTYIEICKERFIKENYIVDKR